jgi:hypothetical protein
VIADLLVCDLDGTLIDSSMALDAELVAAFRAAMARGLCISLATGRMPRAVDRYREALGIEAPVIYYNGALLRDAAIGRDLLSHRLPRGVLTRAFAAISEAPVDPLFFRDERVHCLGVTPDIRHFCDVENLVPTLIRDPGDFLHSDAFVKGLCIGAPDDLARLRATLDGLLAGEARLVRTAGRYLEIVPAAASKGAALLVLAEHLGIRMDRVVAVGDQENDLEMIRAAGLGVAMPHAPADVRAAADRVAPHSDQGGLLALFAEVLPDYFRPRSGRAEPREEISCPE